MPAEYLDMHGQCENCLKLLHPTAEGMDVTWDEAQCLICAMPIDFTAKDTDPTVLLCDDCLAPLWPTDLQIWTCTCPPGTAATQHFVGVVEHTETHCVFECGDCRENVVLVGLPDSPLSELADCSTTLVDTTYLSTDAYGVQAKDTHAVGN